ncbi:integrase core domain-containing protein [Gimesia sp.]|uniref:integrase core domain-containing protein n=1 Tax=Gimesia sp. TaxID=2024833 RepID=UPI0032EEEBB4
MPGKAAKVVITERQRDVLQVMSRSIPYKTVFEMTRAWTNSGSRLLEEKRGRKKKPVGRPGKSAVMRELILKIAREKGFGYTRILGELRKLGISRICRQTVKNIIKEAGIEPSPKRSTGTWDQFLKSHAETLRAWDFFTKRAVTPRGIVDLYVLVFMHLETREVFVTPSTRSPDSAWVTNQVKAFVNHVTDRDEKPTCLIHDRDTKFSADFRQFLKNKGIQPKRLPIRSPNLNARVERFVQTIKYEALNHFIAFVKVHLDYLVSEFVDYYNKHRAHSSREYLPPCSIDPPPEYETIKLDEIHCEEHLGGLIKSYERIAA